MERRNTKKSMRMFLREQKARRLHNSEKGSPPAKLKSAGISGEGHRSSESDAGLVSATDGHTHCVFAAWRTSPVTTPADVAASFCRQSTAPSDTSRQTDRDRHRVGKVFGGEVQECFQTFAQRL